MTLYLPTTQGYVDYTVTPIDFGGVMIPDNGGAEQRLNRLGNRWSLSVQLPVMHTNAAAYSIIADLCAGLLEGFGCRFPQLGIAVGTPGAALVNGAGQLGSAVNLKALSPGYVIRKGQMFGIIVGGVRYIYQSKAAVTVSGGGLATIPIYPPLRASPGDNGVCEFAPPIIEGFLRDERPSWTVSRARTVGISFTVAEAR